MDTFRLETNVVVDKFIILHATIYVVKRKDIILPSPFGNHGLEQNFVIKKIGLGLNLNNFLSVVRKLKLRVTI